MQQFDLPQFFQHNAAQFAGDSGGPRPLSLSPPY
jgi:hypothetical protein